VLVESMLYKPYQCLLEIMRVRGSRNNEIEFCWQVL